jgi:two-component system nitrate/nitrite response regulator NarL
MDNVQIVLVDSDQLFREGLKQLLEGSEFTVMAEAEDINEAMAKLDKSARPALAVLEFDATSQDVSTLRLWREKYPDTKLVVLAAATHNVLDLARCFEAGADAYLLKTISSDALKQSMALVLLGEKVFPTRLAAMLMKAGGAGAVASSADLDGMSGRENQVLRCLLSGQSNKVIAKHLNITEATVKVHLKSVLKKINASNRTQAAIWALHNGLSTECVAQG